jgi:hypothetical protein
VAQLGLMVPGAGDDEVVMRSQMAILLKVRGAAYRTTPPS